MTQNILFAGLRLKLEKRKSGDRIVIELNKNKAISYSARRNSAKLSTPSDSSPVRNVRSETFEFCKLFIGGDLVDKHSIGLLSDLQRLHRYFCAKKGGIGSMVGLQKVLLRDHGMRRVRVRWLEGTALKGPSSIFVFGELPIGESAAVEIGMGCLNFRDAVASVLAGSSR
jgi:hypothetical protein